MFPLDLLRYRIATVREGVLHRLEVADGVLCVALRGDLLEAAILESLSSVLAACATAPTPARSDAGWRPGGSPRTVPGPSVDGLIDGAVVHGVVDLRLFLGNLSSQTIAPLAALVPRQPGRRIAVVSEAPGMRFLLNLAQVYFQGCQLRLFADIAAAYQWAALGAGGAQLPLIVPADLLSPVWRAERERPDERGAATSP